MGTSADQLFQRCLNAFCDRDFEAAADLARQLLDEGAGHEILQVLLVSLQRLNRHDELRRIGPQALSVTASHPWLHTLVRLTLGQIDAGEAIAAASGDTERCQARLYAALRLQTLGQAKEAETELDACLAIESPCVERQVAAAIRRKSNGPNGREPLSPAEAAKVFQQCLDLFTSSEYEACLAKGRTLIPGAALRSDLAQLMLICLERLGRKDQLDRFASQVLEATEGHPWFHGLVRLTLGRAEPDEVLAMAATDAQRCQAHYYAGARLLTLGQTAAARAHFDACAAVKVDCPEYALASVERLYPLDGPPVQGQQRRRTTDSPGP